MVARIDPGDEIRIEAPSPPGAQPDERLFEVDSFRGHKASVKRFAISPDGEKVASTGDFGCLVRVWELKTGKPLFELDGGKVMKFGPECVAFSADGKYVLSGHAAGDVAIWDLETRQPRIIPRHAIGIDQVCASADGSRAYSVDRLGAVRLLDVKQGREIKRFPVGASRAIVAPNGKYLLYGGPNQNLQAFDLEKEQPLQRFVNERDTFTAAALSHDGRRAITAAPDGTVRLWDLASGDKDKELANPAWGKTTAFAFSPKGDRVLMGNVDGEIRLLDAVTLREVCKVGQKSRITCLAFTPDTQYVVSSSYEVVVHVWKVER
jgi:WD40 repeat protein